MMELKKPNQTKTKEKGFFFSYRTLPLLLEGSILSQVGLNALSSVSHKILLTKSVGTY